MKNSYLSSAVLAGLLMSSPVSADDIADSITEAQEAYEAGDISTAVDSLNYAVQLLQQMKGEQLSELLPGPLEGWTAGEAESSAVGAAMLGGGLTTERVYQKDDSEVAVQIIADSPMLQGMMAMFSNPMFAASSGGKLTKINGQKVIETYDEEQREGEFKITVANRYMITVYGENVSKDDMVAYTEALDFAKFEQ